jgi:hypothetical protein
MITGGVGLSAVNVSRVTVAPSRLMQSKVEWQSAPGA